jgi:N6-L-threonylcarbamoyladenine synthase
MQQAKVTWKDITAIAVTYGPGLAGSLLIGINTAKAIALAHSLPLIGVNHLEGHIYANWLIKVQPIFPCLCLIVSGGHSDLVLMRGHGQLKKLGQTLDDAAGEAFDKGARVLNLGYPGGPAIETAAKAGVPSISLPRAWLKGSDNFSFSGLKTALLHLVQSGNYNDPSCIADAAASYQMAIIDVLAHKTIQAAVRLGVKQILISGGVAANKTLCSYLTKYSPVPVLIPPLHLCTDNAAMIAACGHYKFNSGSISSRDIDVMPSLSIG